MNEKVVKQLALMLFMLEPLFMLLFSAFLFYTPRSEVFFSYNTLMDGVAMLFGKNIVYFFFSVIASIILFFCSYRKPGTRFLTYCLGCMCLAIPLTMFGLGGMHSAIGMLRASQIPEEIISFFRLIQLITLLHLLLMIFMAYVFLKFRGVNKQIQLRNLLAHEGYRTIFAYMQEATDQEDLRIRYGKSVQENPEIAGHLKRAFKQRNTQLNLG